MPDHNPPAIPPPNNQTLQGIAGLPQHLPGDTRRQAVYSIQGTIYQAWWSIDAWLRLTNADDVIYLEGAEDFDIVKHDSAITVQVKRHASSVSLNTAKAHEALENFWTLSCKDSVRRIDFHYLTTSTIAMEQDANFDGLKGIEAWRAAQTNPELAVKIADYLKGKLSTASPLRAFLVGSTTETIQQRLIDRFHWLAEQPDIDAVKRSVNDRICVLLGNMRRSVSLSSNVQKYLESHFWETVVKTSPTERCLTRSELLRQFESATTTYLPIPVDQLPNIMGNAPPGLNLLALLIQKSPRPPDPLLRRPAVTQRLEELVKQRRIVLLMGSVYKGKTTLAQLVASALCPEAWWIMLTERQPTQVDTLFLALASRIESGDCPKLVIIDDLDVSPTAHRVYRDSLGLLLHRATASGHGVILTAQGASGQSFVVQDFTNIELLDVPELSTEETEALCLEHGCPRALSKIWGTLVAIWTTGHPKLVQVRLRELADRGWPKPSATDLSTQSPAVSSARQMAQQHLSGSVSGSVAEFIYMVSECSVLMHRTVAIRLAESVSGLGNAGDVIDNLTGKWLERVGESWFRATALLKGVAKEVWSPEKYKVAHIRLHDAIRAKGTLDPWEAVALLFHAFVGQDRARLAHTAMRLQTIENDDARHEVERQLLWLPLVALEAGQSITDDVMASAILRQLQFRAASTLDSDTLSQICKRWAEDIERIPKPEVRPMMSAVMWFSIGFSQSLKVPLRSRLQAIAGIGTLQADLKELQADTTRNILGGRDMAEAGIPANGTTAQIMFLFAIRNLRDIASLEELLNWLDNGAQEDIRQQFDAILEWSIVQSLGAFVQGAWASKHEETHDWEPWLALFERINEYAKRRASPRFGREAAKARATILTEYLERSEDALAVLDHADATFGLSAVLLEQRANVLFYRQDDEMVLKLWRQLASDPTANVALDPFAYRRAATSAARLKRWAEAEQIFLAAADSLIPGSFDLTKFGLQVDAALVVSLRGDQVRAAKILTEAVLALPSEATAEDNQRWDAVQRVAVEVCRIIEKAHWKREEEESRIQPGDASSPNLKAPKVESGQAARSEMTRVQVLLLATSLGVAPPSLIQELKLLADSKYGLVRWFASQTGIAHAYGTGAGTGFIPVVLAFERAMVYLTTNRETMSPLEPDDGPTSNMPISPERWLGLLVAGIICSGSSLIAHLERWLDEGSQELGPDAALTNTIRLFFDGASRTSETLDATVREAANPGAVRCGAAAKLLLDLPDANKTFQLQQFLVSALVSDASVSRQELFNLHVARCFAGSWRAHAENRFQFSSPRTSVPALLQVLDDVEKGSVTLRGLLVAAASALGQPVGDFMERVL
jgi:tetratricopeptide (TPR) repeat protein